MKSSWKCKKHASGLTLQTPTHPQPHCDCEFKQVTICWVFGQDGMWHIWAQLYSSEVKVEQNIPLCTTHTGMYTSAYISVLVFCVCVCVWWGLIRSWKEACSIVVGLRGFSVSLCNRESQREDEGDCLFLHSTSPPTDQLTPAFVLMITQMCVTERKQRHRQNTWRCLMEK